MIAVHLNPLIQWPSTTIGPTSPSYYDVLPNSEVYIHFCFPGFSGSHSDRFTVEHRGLLDLLQPGQRTLAGKGYTARYLFARKRCFLTIPFRWLFMWAGSTNACQLSSRQQSHRTVCLKIFHILNGSYSYNYVLIASPLFLH